MLTRDPFWAQASLWLIIGGVVAAAFGSIDFVLNRKIRRLRAAWLHGGGNYFIILLAIFNLLLRTEDAVEGVFPWGILLSMVIALLLAITGWYGGELVFRHGVGVHKEDVRYEQKTTSEAVPTQTTRSEAVVSSRNGQSVSNEPNPIP